MTELALAARVVIRLAVVDDHAAVRASYADYLGSHEDVELVGQGGDGLAAVELCEEHAPDVIVMDVQMPVMDGIEATRAIKTLSPSTRVILVSAYDEDGLLASGLEAGADLFLPKGLTGAELLERVRGLA